jgi:two-component system sensor histidine kinase HydH
MNRSQAFRLSAPWVTVLGAGVISALLLAAVLFIRHSVTESSSLVVRGSSGVLGMAAQEALGETGVLPDAAALQAFLAARASEGLRYVATMDESGAVLASAGTSGFDRPPVMQGGPQLETQGDRVRSGRPLFLGPRTAEPPRRAARLVYEFEPLAAQALESQARRLLGVTGVACIGILALSLAFSRALRQRETLQVELEKGRRLAALGEMSAVLAHELRNPLASLKGHAQLLTESVEADPKLHTKGERVVSEAVRLENRLNDLLAFARGGELHRAAVDPNEVMRASIEAFGADRVEARYGAARPVNVDKALLQQALENVLRNALEASPADKKVEAEVAIVDGQVRLSVRDYGAGITAGDEEKIFEPFMTRKVKGVGLGLAVTRRIVELHGGTVTASNPPGGGAKLELKIPVEA